MASGFMDYRAAGRTYGRMGDSRPAGVIYKSRKFNLEYGIWIYGLPRSGETRQCTEAIKQTGIR